MSSTDLHTQLDTAQWTDVLRALHAAGWTHARRYLSPGRDEDGAPWDDGTWEHAWRRDVAELNAWTDCESGAVEGPLSYFPDLDNGDPFSASISWHMAAELGPAWMLATMRSLGLLDPPAGG